MWWAQVCNELFLEIREKSIMHYTLDNTICPICSYSLAMHKADVPQVYGINNFVYYFEGTCWLVTRLYVWHWNVYENDRFKTAGIPNSNVLLGKHILIFWICWSYTEQTNQNRSGGTTAGIWCTCTKNIKSHQQRL